MVVGQKHQTRPSGTVSKHFMCLQLSNPEMDDGYGNDGINKKMEMMESQ